jgi:hypothetical protein
VELTILTPTNGIQDFVTFTVRSRYSVVEAVHAGGITIGESVMLDLTGILFSSIMMLLIIVRAVRLDSRQPWFQPIKVKARTAAAKTNRWRR